jgi:hypothetical protein
VVLLAALGADFGASIYAEYRLARVVRDKPDWDSTRSSRSSRSH